MKSRRLVRLIASAWGSQLLLVALLVLGGCAANSALPQFPVYPPTAPFLEEQEQRKVRAMAIREFRRRVRAENVARNARETQAGWQPIYNRIAAARQARPERQRRRRELLAAARQETAGEFQFVTDRLALHQRLQPEQDRQRREIVQRARQETAAAFQPILDRLAAHRRTLPEQEQQSELRERRNIGFPQGSRLGDGGRLPRLANPTPP